MDFPLYFEKVIWVGGGHFFRRNFFLKKPNTPEYAQVLVVTCPKPNYVAALLSLPLFSAWINLFLRWEEVCPNFVGNLFPPLTQ